MSTFAVVMQTTQQLTPLGQWTVIGLSVTSLLCALVLSHAEQIPAWKVRFMGAVAVALVLAVLAQTADAAIYIPCTDPAGIEWYWWLIWGC